MPLAGIPDQQCSLNDSVPLLAICGAHVDIVLVVETPAHGVPLNYKIAHGEGSDLKSTMVCSGVSK